MKSYTLIVPTICYDACHLKKFAMKREDLTPTSPLVVDKMHFKGQVVSAELQPLPYERA